MKLTVKRCLKRASGQWIVTFASVDERGNPVEHDAYLASEDNDLDEDAALVRAAEQVRDHAASWDGVIQVSERKGAVGREFDVTLAAVKEVVKEKQL